MRKSHNSLTFTAIQKSSIKTFFSLAWWGIFRYFATSDNYAANAGNADEVENKLKAMNADYLVKESDISDENAVKEIYSAAIERFGKVDILVNNAADCDCDGFDTIEKITPQIIDDTFAVNVRGMILVSYAQNGLLR